MRVGFTLAVLFEFLVYARMSRPAPPSRPLGFQIQCPDRQRATHRSLAQIKLNEDEHQDATLGTRLNCISYSRQRRIRCDMPRVSGIW